MKGLTSYRWVEGFTSGDMYGREEGSQHNCRGPKCFCKDSPACINRHDYRGHTHCRRCGLAR